MKTNPNEPAIPMQNVGFTVENPRKGYVSFDVDRYDIKVNLPGLSIRAELAARNMAAMLSNPYGVNMPDGTKSFLPEFMAKQAVLYADALINELNKEQ